DAHSHIGTPGQGLAGPVTPPEYVFKLWLAHGITTVREVGSGMGLAWTVDHARRSEEGKIVAPRIIPYSMFPGRQIVGDKAARKWVRAVKKKGAQGVKLRGWIRWSIGMDCLKRCLQTGQFSIIRRNTTMLMSSGVLPKRVVFGCKRQNRDRSTGKK
ncbi:hypothetical protein N9I26_06690, partial [Pseudomonadales bacterium]|nr:hypothetical protein [Pseudomonadales bacterium]